MPTNSTISREQRRTGFHGKNLEWSSEGVIKLQIPSRESKEWLYGKMPGDNPWISFAVIPVNERWEGSVTEWVIKEFGGTVPNLDTCLTPGRRTLKTPKDYPAPHFIDFKSHVISLESGEGEAVQFEACRQLGELYATLVHNRIFLLYEAVPPGAMPSDTDLLQKIIENLRVNT